MDSLENDLSAAKSEGDLIAVSRKGIASFTLQAQVIDYSADLVLLRYFSEFTLDGYLMIRRDDISGIECRATDRFQFYLLKEEGVITEVLGNPEYNIKSFVSALQSLPENQVVILKDEKITKTFSIGVLRGVTDDTVTIHCFTGAGNWEAEADIVDPSALTCIQLESRYILPFQRHFNRHQTYPAI